jgi:hypothetical protein
VRKVVALVYAGALHRPHTLTAVARLTSGSRRSAHTRDLGPRTRPAGVGTYAKVRRFARRSEEGAATSARNMNVRRRSRWSRVLSSTTLGPRAVRLSSCFLDEMAVSFSRCRRPLSGCNGAEGGGLPSCCLVCLSPTNQPYHPAIVLHRFAYSLHYTLVPRRQQRFPARRSSSSCTRNLTPHPASRTQLAEQHSRTASNIAPRPTKTPVASHGGRDDYQPCHPTTGTRTRCKSQSGSPLQFPLRGCSLPLSPSRRHDATHLAGQSPPSRPHQHHVWPCNHHGERAE